MTELVPDPGFDDPAAWDINGLGAVPASNVEISGSQLNSTSSTCLGIVTPADAPLMVVGKTYQYEIEIESASGTGIANASIDNNILWQAGTLESVGAVTVSGEIVYQGTVGLKFVVTNKLVAINMVSVRPVDVSGGGYLRGFSPPKGYVTPKKRAKQKKDLKRTIKKVVRKRLDFSPVDIDEDKLNEIEKKIEELLNKKYELDELYHMALVAERLDAGKGVPYDETFKDVSEDFIPIVDAVIQQNTSPHYDSKYDDVIKMFLFTI